MQTDQAAPKTIDEYIAGFPQDIQEILEKIRVTIRKAAPDAQEAIKYQMPAFTLKGNLVHFAAFKKHIGFYPVPTGIEKFKDELSVYEGGKGSVQFPSDYIAHEYAAHPVDCCSGCAECGTKTKRSDASSGKPLDLSA